MDASNNPPPALIISSNDRLWIVLSHLSALLGVGIVLPLIIYLVKKDESPSIAYHAKEALNFHISIYLYALACIPLVFVFIGFPLLLVVIVSMFVLSIIAAVRAADGVQYRYPFTLRLVK